MVDTEHTGAADLREDDWFHVLSGQDALGYARFYLNGILVASSPIARSVRSSTTSVAVRVGASGTDDGPTDTPLAIDDLILLDSPVSQSIARRLYEGTLP